MVKKIALILVFLLGISLVLAADTAVTIKTKPLHNVSVHVINVESENTIESFDVNSDANGVASVTSTTNANKIYFSIIVRLEGKIIDMKKFGNYTTGMPITLDLEKKAEATNTTQTSITNITTNITNADISANITSNQTLSRNQTQISGSLISEVKSYGKKIAYWVAIGIGAVIVLALIAFIAIKIMKIIKTRTPLSYKVSTYKVSKLDELEERQILDAEKKIKEAQTEIEKIKLKKNFLVEAEKKYQEAKRNFEEAEKQLKKAKKEAGLE